MMLHELIKTKRKAKEILLMSHAVVGFPHLHENSRAIAALVQAGVDIVELQIPFSDPIADGPVLMDACHVAVQNKITVEDGLRLASMVCSTHPQTIFLFMSYLNPLVSFGIAEFIARADRAGVKGVIIPDLPPEKSSECNEIKSLCAQTGMALIFMVTPDTSDERLAMISGQAEGMIYCVSRSGVTGLGTIWNQGFEEYLNRTKKAFLLPVAVGFGVKSREDVDYLRGKADVAIICSEFIRRYARDGLSAATKYMQSLTS